MSRSHLLAESLKRDRAGRGPGGGSEIWRMTLDVLALAFGAPRHAVPARVRSGTPRARPVARPLKEPAR